ncbi:MAG: ATP-dependent ligase clustered with Ku protein LigD, partial [Amycolatopsis sp.]|nr:ATP-dependent ligase clustered with Ku protein LigD [Amycolatopsis sp.]
LGAGVRVRQPERTSAYDKPLAEQFAAETPDLVVSKMAKALREGKVFVDWSQNNPSKNTVAPYSLRGREHPTVSTPVTSKYGSTDVRHHTFPDQATALNRVQRSSLCSNARFGPVGSAPPSGTASIGSIHAGTASTSASDPPVTGQPVYPPTVTRSA